MNTREYFENELKILKKNKKKDVDLLIEDFIDNIRDIIEIFRKQGHSGGSAPYYSAAISSTIKKVLSFEPLSPIMGTDDEWSNEIDPNTYQNERCTSLFKTNILKRSHNKPYYLNAIVWQGEDEYDTFTGTVEDIASWQYIKGFPFTPKKFYINVKRVLYDIKIHKNMNYTSCDAGDYVYLIKNRNELKKVEEYYDMLEQLKKLNPQKYYKITRKNKLEKIKEINENKNNK